MGFWPVSFTMVAMAHGSGPAGTVPVAGKLTSACAVLFGPTGGTVEVRGTVGVRGTVEVRGTVGVGGAFVEGTLDGAAVGGTTVDGGGLPGGGSTGVAVAGPSAGPLVPAGRSNGVPVTGSTKV